MSPDKKTIGTRLRAEREARRWGRGKMAVLMRAAARRVGVILPEVESVATSIKLHESGKHAPGADYRAVYATVFGKPEAELFAPEADATPALREDPAGDDELEALELARRVAASDVSDETLSALEMIVDELASAYPGTPPATLLPRVRRHLAYVTALMDGRKTLAQNRRLIIVGGWLSLLAATCDIDIGHRPAAAARLRAAAQLGEHADHPEIMAWCLETQAWQLLTDKDYQRAVTAAQGAQAIAPRGGSAYIQATAQEGRAWARLGAGPQTRDVLARVERLVAPLATPDRPEHHYRYDPAKSDAYTATTLSWLGDPAAEPYARQVLARLETAATGPPRPRRAASARLDLALALLASDKPDEAAQTALEAVTSGRLVPSNYWRAAEILSAGEARGVPEAVRLHEAYRELCASSQPPDDAE
jgi:transcriptional regulator with XRE-family HTH domain